MALSAAEANLGAAKFWLGVKPQGVAERIVWIFNALVGTARVVLAALRTTLWCLGLLLVGLGVNLLVAGAFAALFVLFLGKASFVPNFELGMMVTLFLSLVAMVRVGGPDVMTIALGAVPRRQQRLFREAVVTRVRSIARSTETMPDPYRAAARFWIAKPQAFTELIAYICVCITQLSLFMTFAVLYFQKATPDLATFALLFLYYLQLGLDGSFFNLLDLAGVELSNVRPEEPFALRLVRFSIYTIYLSQIVGYAVDILTIDLEAERTALLGRFEVVAA